MAYPLCSGSEGAFAAGTPATAAPPLDGAACAAVSITGETILV
ncbi:MAG TPA: hypothetical protein VMJ11_26320 [Paraburkholderia sp.]|nr:hypothetical protein [Paraburkholderia sp.]HTR10105.1 hypothetical protein [Paraburkholderia sp.]